MGEYKREFSRDLYIKELMTNTKIRGIGTKKEKLFLGKNSTEYDVISFNNNITIELMALATNIVSDKQPCIILSIGTDGVATLPIDTCGRLCYRHYTDIHSDIVFEALEIARIKGAKTFEFTDRSTKKINNIEINLTDLSFLTTGKTWYERILPIKPLNSVYYIETCRKKVMENSWHSVSEKLLQNGVSHNFDISNIDINEPGSAMKVLERAKLSRQHHEYFHKHMNKLISASGILGIRGTEWTMDII